MPVNTFEVSRLIELVFDVTDLEFRNTLVPARECPQKIPCWDFFRLDLQRVSMPVREVLCFHTVDNFWRNESELLA